MSKLITIEGTDSSGKHTQTILLYERLISENIPVKNIGFPRYDTPTGKIVGGPYLGKKHICEGFFPQGAANVDPKTAAFYFAADRYDNVGETLEALKNGQIVLSDRYVESNMAHQGAKISTKEERLKLYKWLEALEYTLSELPKPDFTIFLHLPYKYSLELISKREEEKDQHESDEEHLKNAEQAYLELVELYAFEVIECVKDNKVRTPEDIHEEVYELVRKKIGF